jgi:hypothetical protein
MGAGHRDGVALCLRYLDLLLSGCGVWTWITKESKFNNLCPGDSVCKMLRPLVKPAATR